MDELLVSVTFHCNPNIGLHAATDQYDAHTHFSIRLIYCMIHWINDLIDYNVCCIQYDANVPYLSQC